jgi:predicted amidophosphoribosyltransferase
MNDITNCPNCGAPITGSRCEYCGTVFKFNNDRISKLKMENQVLQNLIVTNELYRRALDDMRRYCK